LVFKKTVSACHCEHLKVARQSIRRRDCGVCSGRRVKSRSGSLRFRPATTFAMTIFIAGFGFFL
jgi:hypothetical protein